MNFNLLEIHAKMGPFGKLIAYTLILFALGSLIVFFERLFFLLRARGADRRFVARAGKLLQSLQHEQLAAEASTAKGSMLARLLGGGLKTYLQKSREPQGKLGVVELTRRELERHYERIGEDVRRGMNVLATVGSVAPFVGLLGTVVGIIEAFGSIAKEGSGGLGAVSAGISEALVVTALGLLVAIPAVMMFNFLSARSDALMLSLDLARKEFVDHLEDTHGGRAPAVSGEGAVALAAERATKEGRDVRTA